MVDVGDDDADDDDDDHNDDDDQGNPKYVRKTLFFEVFRDFLIND